MCLNSSGREQDSVHSRPHVTCSGAKDCAVGPAMEKAERQEANALWSFDQCRRTMSFCPRSPEWLTLFGAAAIEASSTRCAERPQDLHEPPFGQVPNTLRLRPQGTSGPQPKMPLDRALRCRIENF